MNAVVSESFSAAALHRCARPLVALATQLRTAVPARPSDTGATLATAVETFEHDLVAAGADARTVTAASYLLCVWLDEVISPHAWAAPHWPATSLLMRFHREADGRTRVFQLLERLARQPDSDRPLLELFHVCLSLGLQGRCQDLADGARQLAAMRTRLATLLGLDAAPLAQPLSVRWQPAVAPRRPGRVRRLAVGGLMLMALTGLGVYTGSQWQLARQADQVFASLQGLERSSRADRGEPTATAAVPMASLPGVPSETGNATSAASAIGTATATVSAPGAAPAAGSPPVGRLAVALAADVRAGRIGVRDDAHRSSIVMAADGLFKPDTTQVAAAQLPLLERLAHALAGPGGRVLVTAHASAQAARPARVPSTAQLADEWARAVAQVLQRRLPAGSVSSAGLVLAPDDAATGRTRQAASGGAGNAPRSLIEVTLFP